MAWLTVPVWGAANEITRQRALKLLPRIPAEAKKKTAAGYLIREGTPKPENLPAGRPKKPK